MNTLLLLNNSGGFSWQKSDSLHVEGYLFDRSGRFYEGNELLEYFSGISSFAGIEERVSFANGCFSVILSTKEEIYISCDPIRAFPVFYAQQKGGWIISDDAGVLMKNAGISEKNDISWKEFLATGYVTGAETLIQGINQVQAGEVLHLKVDEFKRKFYFSYRTAYTSNLEYNELKEEGIQKFENTFKRLVDSFKGRTVVVPLSGGFDSRLIAVMLKKYGYTNVVCLTYGRAENPEVKISRKVAEKLGFKWICVEYTEKLIEGFIDDFYFKNYYPYASNLVSMFFLQEYFAVRYLKENRLISDDSIFVPGHSGDFLGGSQLNKHGNLLEDESIQDIAERLFFIKYCYLRPSGKSKGQMLERIERNLEEKFTGEKALAFTIQEDWDYKEKLAKFNANSSSAYTFFGYGFRLPFWDRELVDFFKILPLHMKINKYLYDDILTNTFFAPVDLNFVEELQVSEKVMKRQSFKNRIKFFLPQFVKRVFLTRLDNLYYNEITRQLVNDMSAKGKKIVIYNNSYNSLIIQWYLEEIKEVIKKSR